MTQRRNLRRRGSSSTQPRRLHHQTLERRELLAAEIISGPRLVSVAANTGSQFDLTDNNVLSVAPSELTFRFDGGSQVDGNTLDGIRFVAAGGDGTFDNDDFLNPIQPGFLGFEGDQTGGRVVVARFADTLADDRYRIVISGYDDTALDVVALRDASGQALTLAQPDDPQRPAINIDFEIEVGPRVVAVVPQPITTVGTTRVQARNQVHVFFNNDPLSNPNAGVVRSSDAVVLPVVNPDFYKLIFTNDTVENTDDPVYAPTLVEYDPALNRATLTFDSDLSELPDVVVGPTTLAGPQSNNGSGTFRLRVGRGDAIPATPAQVTASELPDTFASAQPLNVAFGSSTQSVVVDGGLIQSTKDIIPDWPGAFDAAGLRDYRREAQLTQRTDTTTGINVYPYNFAQLYGTGTQGQLLDNAITEAQKQRAREALDLYSKRMGVQFVETEDSGLQIVTGDLQAVVLTADTGAGEGTPYSLYRVNESDPSRGVLVLDAGEPWFDGYGLSPDSRPSWFVEALRGVGNLIGIGDLFELPDGVAAGGSSPDEPNSEFFSDFAGNAFPDLPTEPEFLSQSDITLGQALHRPESDDVDFYSFNVAASGRVTAETFAQRLDGSSLLDTLVQLYRVIPAAGSQPTTFQLVASNDDFFSNDSLVAVDIEAGNYILGVSSTGNDAYNGEVEGSALGGRTEGIYQLRVTFEPDSNNTITDTSGSKLDGDADGVEGGEFNFWFRTARELSAANEPRVIYVVKDASSTDTNDGSFADPVRTIQRAFEISRPGDIVRLLPSGGADNLIETVGDNPAYEIGRGGTGDRALADGDVFEVPQGVTVMIDAGAILKLRTAKISVGSESVDEDRSLAALQVLGTPEMNVFFTSFDDPTIGIDNNPSPTQPARGHWAGVEFRNDFDYAEGRPVWETEGIFLDYVSHANMQYGGGKIDTNAPVVTPLQMFESRPTLIYNTIQNSADAAISADPDSFLESNFHSPRYQTVSAFTSDYSRVGPEISSNTLLNNTINALFVRVDTPAAGERQSLTVSGRFDDRDIVHAISEVLTIQGNPGGPVLLEERPDVLSVTVATSTTGGTLPNGTYDYVVTFVTSDGVESLASLPTRTINSTTGAVRLSNLAPATDEFVGRKLYRRDLSAPAGVIRYELVTQLDRRGSVYVDDGTTRGGILASEQRPDVSGVTLTAVPGPVGDSELLENRAYDYRMTFVDVYGGETRASEASTMRVVARNDGIQLDNLPATADGFIGRNLYRLEPVSGEYILVARLNLEETSFLDRGFTTFAPATLLGKQLGSDIDGGTKLLPRFDARLAIDPGIIVKSESGRIEATFGADFYAEGSDGDKVIFTSRADDTYGAGGTFDNNNNGPSVGTPGDWGGLVFRQDTTASLDFAEVRFAGGTSPVEGGFAEFNALEILQADVRVTNSTFTRNADGFTSNDTREGRGFNDESVIFVRGSQPVILNNVIADNEGAAISINPDALNFHDVLDGGRSTGPSDIIATDLDNQGPLIAGNLLDLNDLNGLRVRSEIVTTDSVWDDTDIVHVVEGSIFSMTNHFYGGLRLKSDVGQSLVVKFGPGGTLVGGGRPLDITDRIGGTLQVIGTPGNPVVLTSLNDITVGAGFTPDGRALLQTSRDAGTAAAGDWQGLQLRSYINDRNVAYVLENERALASDITINASPDDAQVIGDLARHEYAGDENERLGFNIRGTLATPQDQDVYRFTATGGTELFIDIDETSFGLDTVVELINVNEDVVASSNNSFTEATDDLVSTTDQTKLFVNPNLPNGVSVDDVRPLFQLGTGNVESPNSLDAGFRVVLPGDTQRDNTYYIRVRTLDQKTDGQYLLSLRLRETGETAGSTVQLADIRFATDAISVTGAPLHSPLVGDVGEEVRYVDPTPGNRNSGDEQTFETENNRLGFTLGGAQTVGNLLTSDRGALVISGEIGNINSTNLDVRIEDVDVFRVDLFAQQISPDVFDSENRFVTATFDIDYADALGRVNSSISVYNAAGQLILHSRDSNIADDQGRPLNGVDMANLEGGSAGVLDAYIGPVELPEGTYYVAVSGEVAVPQALDQFFNPNSASPLTRLMPINSVRRIAEDRLDENSFAANPDDFRQFETRFLDYTAEAPVVEPIFDDVAIVPYTLDDIRLFVSLDGAVSGNNNSVLVSVNPFTGQVERLIGQSGQPTGDIAMRRDGELFSYSLGPQNGPENNGNVGNFLNISPFNAAANSAGDDGIGFQRNNAAGTDLEADPNAQLDINAIAFTPGPTGTSINTNAVSDQERFFLIGNRDNFGRGEIPFELTRNILYQAVASNGAITSLGSTDAAFHRTFDGTIPYQSFNGTTSADIEHGVVDTGFIYETGGDGGNITGLTFAPNDFSGQNFLAVTDEGGIHGFNRNELIAAPQDNLELARYNRVIPTTFFGRVVADPNHFTAPFDFTTGQQHPQFESLTLGPASIENGRFSQLLFAGTADGWLYALELDGQNAVPANVFYNGRSAIQMQFVSGSPVGDGARQVNGLAFSNLQINPWHVTGDRFENPGHGMFPDNSRTRIATTGGASLYYGFEVTGNAADNTIARPDADPLGQIAPGGSHGSVVSRPFDLTEFSSADKPTLYFSYFIDVEGTDDQTLTRAQNDSFRVFGAGDDGEWQLLATNNNFRELPFDDEYDYFNETGIIVQEIFDDGDDWRQARIDVSPLAGNENVQIRFDFSTAGSMRTNFGSINVSGVRGSRLIDNEVISFFDDEFNPVQFQTVLGRDLVFPAGADLQSGDQVTVLGPNGPSVITFVTSPSVTPKPLNEVVFNVGMTEDEVARTVVASVDTRLRPYFEGDGRVSFLAASDVIIDGELAAGQSNPVRVTRGGVSVQIPDSATVNSGDAITIFTDSNVFTVLLEDSRFTEPQNLPTGVFQVVYEDGMTGQQIAELIVSALPNLVSASIEEDGWINFSTAEFVNTDFFSNTNGAGATRILVPSGATFVVGEEIVVTGPDGVVTTLVYTNVDNAVAPATFAPGEIFVSVTDTKEAVARKILQQLPTNTQAYINSASDLVFLNSATEIDFTSAPTSIEINQVLADEVRINITIPNGTALVDNELLTLIDADGLAYTVRFADIDAPDFIGDQVIPFDAANAGTPAATIARRLFDDLPARFSATLQGNTVSVSATRVTTPVTGTQIVARSLPGRTVSLPDATGLIDGETVTAVTEFGPVTITFVQQTTGTSDPGVVFFDPTAAIPATAEEIALRFEAALPGFVSAAVDGNSVNLYGTFGSTQQTPDLLGPSNVSTSALLGQEVIVPAGFQLVAGETLVIDDGGTLRTITFVNGAPANGDEVEFQPGDSAADIAQRLIAVLGANAPTLRPGTANTVRFAADSATAGTRASAIGIQSLISNDFIWDVNLPSGDLLRNGEQITVFVGFQPTVITFIREGQSVANAGDVQVFFNDTTTPEELGTDIVLALKAISLNFGAYVDQALDGFRLNGNVNFVFVSNSPSVSITLEQDVATYAIPITLPRGGEIIPGEQFTVFRKDDPFAVNSQTYTFVTTPAATPFEIFFDVNDTADALARRVATALDSELQAVVVNGREVHLLNAISVEVAEADSLVVSFASEVDPDIRAPFDTRPTPIQVDSTLTGNEVATRMQVAFAEGFGRLASAATGFDQTARAEQYPITGGDTIRLYNATALDVGSYGLSAFGFGGTASSVPADEFGLSVPLGYATSQIGTAGAADNEVEGVYIDDIIIGLAERGEMVINAPINNTTFVFDPSVLPDSHPQAVQPERQNETLVGPYSLEIRTADEYGVPQDYDPINLELDDSFSSGRSFDSNDRLSDGAVTLITQAGENLVDVGTSLDPTVTQSDRFVLDDGTNQLTFEFDSILDTNGVETGHVRVPFDPSSDDAAAIARAIRDAINSAQVQSVLNITAATADGIEQGASTSSRVELFGNAISVNPSGGRFIKMDLVKEETFAGLATSRRIAIVDHDADTVAYDNYADQLAQSAVTGFVNGDVDTFVGVGKIGDTVNMGVSPFNIVDDLTVLASDPRLDIDSVRVYLSAGQSVDIDVDTVGFTKAGQALELPVISVFQAGDNFNVNGNVLAFSGLQPTRAPGESLGGAFINFTAPTNGFYDVVVSNSFVYGNDPISPTDEQRGEYQLTIRPNAAASARVPDRDVLMVDYQFGITDVNRTDDQGQIIISSNFISDSANFGITATSGDRGQGNTTNGLDQDTRPGSARLLRNVNPTGLIPGAVIINNVVSNSGTGGILFAGGSFNDGESPAPNLFGRIVNNTVVNTGGGSGITVDGRANPTILNNIISGFNVGINADTVTSGNTVVGGNAFQDNNTNSTLAIASSSIIIAPGTPLFQDADRPIYIPVENSPVIDSSFASLPERSNFFNTVKNPIGIAASPIIAPRFDAYGQPRVDGQAGSSTGGAGANVFIDRGALDRADDRRPVALLINPFDADGVEAASQNVTFGDTDPGSSFVRLTNPLQTVEFFEIQLVDPSGTGPDPETITVDSVLLTENGRRLLPGRDFTFGYSANSRTIRLTPLAGLWRQDAVYEITLNNQRRIAFDAVSGDQISDGDQVTVLDAAGRPTVFEFESGISVSVPQTSTLRVLDVISGFRDRDVFTITSPAGASETFEINLTGSTAAGNAAIELAGVGNIADIRGRILGAINRIKPGTTQTYAEILDLAPVAIGFDSIQLGVLSGHSVTLGTGGGTFAGLELIGTTMGVESGQSFQYTSNGITVDFVFDDSNSFVETDTMRQVPIMRTSTPDQVAEAIVQAVGQVPLGLDSAQATGDGSVLLGGMTTDVLDITNSSLTRSGMPGVTGSLTLTVPNNLTGNDVDGQAFTLDVGGVATTFRFTTNASLTSPDRLILVNGGDDAATIASKAAATIGLVYPDELNPQATGNVIVLNEASASVPAGGMRTVTTINTGTSSLTQAGLSGGAIPVPFLPSTNFSEASVAATLQRTILDANLGLEIFAPGGGTLLIDGAISVTGRFTGSGTLDVVGLSIPAVSDLAGNAVRETRVNDETRFTIIMPEVRFDFGDAPASYSTLLESPLNSNIPGDGARHAVIAGSIRLGGSIDTEDDGRPSPSATDDSVGDDVTVVINASSASTAISLVIDGDIIDIEITTLPTIGDTLTLVIGSQSFVFEFLDVATNPSPGNIPVLFNAASTLREVELALLTAIRPRLSFTGGGVDALTHPTNAQGIRVRAIDDEDGVSIVRFDDGLNFFRVFGEPGAGGDVITALTADQVLGFLNPFDEAGTDIAVDVVGGGLLNGWIDFDRSGTFDENEHVLANVPVTTGTNILNVTTPLSVGTLPFDTWARFRVNDGGNVGPNGVAIGGEVEDYLVSVLPIPLPQPEPRSYTAFEDDTLSVDPSQGLISAANRAGQLLPVRYFVVDEPTNGTLVIDTSAGVQDDLNGSFRYIPNPDFYGIDTFTYRLSTQQNLGNIDCDVDAGDPPVCGTVTLNVVPENDAPGASDQSFVMVEATAASNTPLTITAAELIAGSTPDADAQFNTASNADIQDETNQTVFVHSITAGGTTISKDNQFAIADTPEGGTLTATFNPTNEWITSITYTPAADFNSDNGTVVGGLSVDAFTFTLIDNGISELPADLAANLDATLSQDERNVLGIGGGVRNQFDAIGPISEPRTARIRVTPQNDAPVLATDYVGLTDATGAINTDYINFFAGAAPTPTEDTLLVFPATFLTRNDSAGPLDAIDENSGTNGNDAPVVVTSVALVDPTQGTLSIDTTSNEISFRAAPDVYGEIQFTYTAIDSGINEGTNVANVTDAGDRGTRTLNGISVTQTATIFVEPVNDAPVAYDRFLTTTEDTALTFTDAQILAGINVTPSAIIASTTGITVPDADQLRDGETLIVTAANGRRVVVEFNTTGIASVGTNRVVQFTDGETSDVVAARLELALRSLGMGGTIDGSTVRFDPSNQIAFVAAQNAVTVDSANGRVTVPEGRLIADGEIVTVTDTTGTSTRFAFTKSGSVLVTGAVPVAITDASTAEEVATALSTAMLQSGFGAIETAGSQQEFRVRIDDVASISVNRVGSGLVPDGSDVIIPDGTGINAGDVLIVELNDGTVVNAEFQTGTTLIDPNAVLVQFSPSNTRAEISALLEAALTSRGLSAQSVTLTSWQVDLINIVNIDVTGTAITDSGTGILLPAIGDLVSGQTFTLTDENGVVRRIELNTTGTLATGSDAVVQYDPAGSIDAVATELARVLRTLDIGAVASGASVTLRSADTIVRSLSPTSITLNGTNILVPAGDQLIDGERIRIFDNAGNETVVEFSLSGQASPGAGVVVPFTTGDTSAAVASALQESLRVAGLGALADSSALGVPAGQSLVSLQVIATTRMGELVDASGIFDNRLGAPFTENEQAVRIVSFATPGGNTIEINSVPAGDTTATMDSDAGGTYTFTVDSVDVAGQPRRFFSGVTFTPATDYNEQLPFSSRELLLYTIEDDAFTRINAPAQTRQDIGSIRRSVTPGTITITVGAVNDAPVFVNDLNTVNVLERDDLSTTTVEGFLTEIFSAGSTASDELLSQIVTGFEVRLIADVNGVLATLPVVNYVGGATEASLTVQPNPDRFGQATFELFAIEEGITMSSFPPTTFTVNVRPVNDAPRIRPNLTGDAVPNDPDEAYDIASVTDTDGDGFDDQAIIRYTLREDNTQPTNSSDPANAVTTGNYFIPISRAIPEALIQVGSYSRIGLLDIYTVGADNEGQSLNVGFPTGGPQVLELFDFPDRTALGGTLVPRFNGSQLIGLDYTPPVDFNNTIDATTPFDSFAFTVRDDFPGDGETYSLDTDTLVQDRRTSTSIVQLNLNPVNDRPQFVANDLTYEVAEDGAAQRINNFAVGIAAGPPLSAFDEVDFINGQEVRFTVKTLSFLDNELQDFFAEGPSISNTGVLTFEPQTDVYGTFEFEVVLTEILPGSNLEENSTRGDLRSSLPVTLTIDVQPVNDRPFISPQFNTPATNPLNFTLSEDGSFDVLVNGDGTSPGLLDVFQVGPANESANVTPGGNQSLSLTTPIPVTTAEGGTLESIFENGVITRFKYTPRPNFVGTDSFIYTVTDDGVTVPVGTGGVAVDEPRIASGTVRFEVVAVNDAPQFSGAGDVTSNEDQNDGLGRGSVIVPNWATNVQAGPPGSNDEIGSETNPGQPLRFEIIQTSNNPELFVTPPSASIDADGNATLSYVTAEDLNGEATFTVQLFDDGPNDAGNGDVNASTIRTFTINVNPVNDAPTFTPGQIVRVQEDRGPFSAQWATNISPGPIDESGQSVTFEVSTANPADANLFTQSGQPAISPNGILTFTPALNANGIVDLQVIARDSEGLPSAATTLRINVQPVNDFPVATGDTFATNEDTVRVITAAELLANDIDVDLNDANPDQLSIVIDSPQFSLRGALITFDPVTQTVTYDPTVSRELQTLQAGALLNDSFSYAITDRAGLSSGRVSSPVLVTVNVSGVNDGPNTRPDVPTLLSPGSTIIDVLANDEDVDGTINPGSLTITQQPAFGSVEIDPLNGTVTYTPFTNFPGNDEFRYRVADNTGTFSEEEIVTISPNAAPIGRDSVGSGFVNEAIVIDVNNNFTDADGLDFSSIRIERSPLAGEIQVANDGTLRYIPAAGFQGRDSFEYSIADANGRRSGFATVSLQVVASRLQNPSLHADVNDDGEVSALDALLIINHLNRFSSFAPDYVPTVDEDLVVTPGDNGRPDASQPGRFYDVSGDLRISALDALQVINELNRRDAAGGTGEPIGNALVSTNGNLAPQSGRADSRDSSGRAAAGEPLFEVLSENNKLVGDGGVGDDLLDAIASANVDSNQSDTDVSDERNSSLQSSIDAAMAKLL